MSADNFLQSIVGGVGEFYEWLADRLKVAHDLVRHGNRTVDEPAG